MKRNIPNTIEEVFHELWEELGFGEKQKIAKLVNKPLSTLSREISIHDSGAKLGADMVIPLTRAFDSLAAIDFILGELGLEAVEKGAVAPDGDTMYEEFNQTVKAVVDLHAACESLRTGAATLTEVKQAKREVFREVEEDIVRTVTGDLVDGQVYEHGKGFVSRRVPQ